jgi:hypothetical protein
MDSSELSFKTIGRGWRPASSDVSLYFGRGSRSCYGRRKSGVRMSETRVRTPVKVDENQLLEDLLAAQQAFNESTDETRLALKRHLEDTLRGLLQVCSSSRSDGRNSRRPCAPSSDRPKKPEGVKGSVPGGESRLRCGTEPT